MYILLAIPENLKKMAKYLGSVYYDVYEHFQSAIDHLDYHLNMHAENNPEASCKTNS